MNLLRNVPIKRKLTIITMLISCLALLVACIAFVVYESADYYHSLLEELTTKAEMIGYNSSAALSFNDSESAVQTLQSCRADSDIVAVVLYDTGGKPFATYQGQKQGGTFIPPRVEHDVHRLGKNGVELFDDVKFAGENIGTVYILHSFDEFWARSRRYTIIVFFVMAAASAVALLFSRKLLEVISRPISQLAGVVSAVTSAKDYSLRAVKGNNDELGRLIDGFNEMLDQIQQRDSALRDAHDSLEERVKERTKELENEILERQRTEQERDHVNKQLIEVSRQAGMAEVATSVLHNVGNVLTSVNVSCSVISDKVHRSRISSVTRTAELLRAHAGDLAAFVSLDPIGQKLPEFLHKLAAHLKQEQEVVIEELQLLSQNIEHIKDIVSVQQGYAKNIGGVRETLPIEGLVEDALRMTAEGLVRDGVELVREFGDVPPVSLEKHRVLQILVNLVRNAKHALTDSGRPDKKMTLRTIRNNGHIAVSVSDNGVGIAPENLTRIFAHGFTTKKNGHGFGLHSGVLAAHEMGGTLSVQSNGPGTGATFTLQLPLIPPGTATGD